MGIVEGGFSYGASLMAGVDSPKPGVTQVVIYGELGEAMGTATTLAHELRHVVLFLQGKPYHHELRMIELPLDDGVEVRVEYDPVGPVNIITNEAEMEVEERGIDPFVSPFPK